jgi:hypothetical protein
MSKEVKRYDCTDGGARFCQGCYTMSECEFGEYVSWDDYESLLAERDRLREDRDSQQRVCIAEMEKANQLRAEAEALKKGAERAGMRIKELDLLFGRYLLAMKAAVIDSDQRGDEEGMRWIYNSLEGPGELPAEDEIDAQAFFDREIKPINDAMAELLAALQGAQP